MRNRKGNEKTFLLTMVLLLFLWVPGAAGETRIAVADFRNNAEGVTDGARRGITDMLTTELGKMPGVSVIERSRLEAIAKEQRLASSGLMEGSTAVQIGRLAGVQVIITGAITEFASEKSGGVIPLGSAAGIAMGSNEARVTLDVRTIDAETGKVLRTFRETGEAKQDLGGLVTKYGGFAEAEGGDVLAAATYNCVQKVVVQIRKDLQMMGISATFHVVEIRGKKKIFVDAGAMNANAAPGQLFAVFAEGATITGINGEILGVERYHLALLRCLEVKAQYSICELLEGSSAELCKGDLLEPYFEDPKDFKPKSRALAELQSGTPSGSDTILGNPQTLPGPAI
ncbi:MAG TPA: CsgG/HfaB family protein, partial [Synergistaceae bacterium]|nr:CsgG/HfaB family protein [Synergistaceae bacterium]